MNKLVLTLWLLTGTVVAENNVMNMNECIDYALQHAPGYRENLLLEKNKSLSVDLERVKLDPTLSTSYSRDFENPETQSSSMSVKKNWYGGWSLSGALSNSEAITGQDTLARSLTLSKALLKGGSLLESRESLEVSLEALLMETNRLHLERRQLIFNIKKQYYRILKSLETLKIEKLRLERSKRNLEHAIEREEPMDIATAKLEVPNSEISVLSAEMTIESSLDELKALMGMSLDVPIELDRNVDFAFLDLNLERDSRECLLSHESFLNQNLTIRQAQRKLKISKAQRWPSLDLSGKISQDSQDGFHHFDTQDRSVSLNMDWTIGSRSAGVGIDMQENNCERERITLRRMELQKKQTLRRLFRQLEEQKQSIKLQEAQVELKKLQVELYQDRWNEGEIDILEYVRNQNELENTRVNLINRRMEYLELLEQYFFEAGDGARVDRL